MSDPVEEIDHGPGNLDAFLSHPIVQYTGTLAAPLSAPTARTHTSSRNWDSQLLLAIPDNIPMRLRHSLLGAHPTLASLVSSQKRYTDAQFCPPMFATEGDVSDSLVRNILQRMVMPLNDIIRASSPNVPKENRWRIELRAQTASTGARTDHFYVAIPPGLSYNPVHQYMKTTEEVGSSRVPEQCLLLIVEEKRLGHLPRLLQDYAWRDTTEFINMSRTLRSTEATATYSQLLKYSAAYKCTRLLLTDYTNTYGLHLGALPESKASASNRDRRAPAGPNPMPDVVFYHWMSTNMRQDIFFLCLSGLKELRLWRSSQPSGYTPQELLNRLNVELSTALTPPPNWNAARLVQTAWQLHHARAGHYPLAFNPQPALIEFVNNMGGNVQEALQEIEEQGDEDEDEDDGDGDGDDDEDDDGPTGGRGGPRGRGRGHY